jgi:ParB family chromosome partitioning protein
MELLHIPLSELSIAKVNVRQGTKKIDYADLIPSIRERGILQPLLVRKNGKGFEIVAGRRRYLAALSLEKDGLEVEALPCAIMAKGDDAAAVEASLIENVAHLPMDDMDQFEAFNRLLKEGRSVDDIAHVFGVTEITVKRRLAIANLLPKIRQLYRNEEIDPETLRALTLASKPQQKDWLALFDDEEQHAPTGQALKRWLMGGQNIPTSAALFDLKTYEGEIIADLFGEESYFANPDTFWTLQGAAIEALKHGFLIDHWSRVDVMERGQRFYEWEHEATPKEQGGAVFITVSERGEVEVHEGYLSRSEARKRESKERGEPEAIKPAKPELTAPMQNYVELHRLAAIRLELLNFPAVALRLALAHIIAGSHLWLVKPEPQKAAKPEIGASVAANPATQAFEERRRELIALAGLNEGRSELVRPNGDDYAVAELFARFLKLNDDDVLRILALAMAETLACGSAASEAAAMTTGATLNDWRPDQTFLDLLGGKDVVTAILSDIATPAIAEGNKAETGKVQKGIIKDYLDGTNGRSQNADWLPSYFQFPAKAYTYRGGICVVERWKSVQDMFTPAL